MYLGDKIVVEAIGMDFIVVEIIIKGKINNIHIKYAFYIPKLHVNLFSVSKLVLHRLNVQFNLNECIIKSFNIETIMNALRKCNLYKINFVNVYETVSCI